MEGKVVYSGKTKHNHEIVIRYIDKNDYKIMADYINTISDECTYITYQGQHMTYESEEKFVQGKTVDINEGRSVMLLVLCDDRIVGIAGIDTKPRVEDHVGIFGITVAKEFRGEGIGRLLMQAVIDEAKKNIPKLKIITLGVFKNNSIARKMYESFGFVQYGNLPEGIMYKGQPVDHIEMYLKV